MREWAISEAKILINDIEYREKHQVEIQRMENQYKSSKLNSERTQYLSHEIKKEDVKDEIKVNEEEEIELNESENKELESISNKRKIPNKIISSLFLKKDSENVSEISSINGENENEDDNTEDLQNKNLEALRKRIERMKSNEMNQNKKRSLKCVALSVLFIEYLKKMVDQHRPTMAIEFERNLSQISKPYQTLTCNYLKLYSLSVFRSIQRSKITLIGFNTKRIFSIFNTFKNNTSSDDTILWIRVHILKLIQCFNKYLQVLDNSLIQFFNSHLLTCNGLQ